MKFNLSAPDIGESEKAAVMQVLSSGNLSIGPMVENFELNVAKFCDTKHAIACNSGTSALHLVVKSLGIDGGEIITTPFSFIASSNCAVFVGAKPRFVDIDPLTWNIDPKNIKSAINSQTKAILPVHIFGITCDMGEVNSIAKEYGLPVIEDSCEALGSKYQGKMAGSLGDAGVFGFYPNKQITTGEGGMIVTDRDDIAKFCRAFRNQGRLSGWLSHEFIGYNYRMPDINAAIGSKQMERLPIFIKRRDEIVNCYKEHFRDYKDIETQQIPGYCIPSWFAFVIKIHDRFSVDQKFLLIEQLRNAGVGCNNYFASLHLQKCYEHFGYKRGDFPECERISDRTIALPLHTKMTKDDVEAICLIVKDQINCLN